MGIFPAAAEFPVFASSCHGCLASKVLVNLAGGTIYMTLAIAVLALSSLAYLVGLVWVISVAFNNGDRGWGYGLIVANTFGNVVAAGPILLLVFIILHWGDTRRAAALLGASIGLGVVGLVVLFQAAQSTLADAMKEVNQQMEQAAANQAQAQAQNQDPAESGTPSRPPETEKPASPSRRAESRPARTENRAIPPDGAESVGAPSAASAPREPVAEPSALPKPSPVQVQFMDLGAASPNQMRRIRARLINAGDKTVRELKLGLTYWDAAGNRMGTWTTVHGLDEPLPSARSTNTFELTGFRVPQFTDHVKFVVETVTFGDGSRWPEAR